MKVCILAVLVALAGARTASAQDKDKDKASDVLRKCAGELVKKEGYRLSETIAVPGLDGRGGGGAEPLFEGVVKKDLAVLRGPCTVYFRGATAVAKAENGSFADPKNLIEQNPVPEATRNPGVVVADILKFARAATFGGEEALGARDCRVILTKADPAPAFQHLSEMARRIRFQSGYPDTDRIGLIDKARSTSSYKVWVGKDDLLFHKIVWTINMVTDKSKMSKPLGDALPDTYVGTYTIEIKDYDKELTLDLPKEVKAKLGVKDDKK